MHGWSNNNLRWDDGKITKHYKWWHAPHLWTSEQPSTSPLRCSSYVQLQIIYIYICIFCDNEFYDMQLPNIFTAATLVTGITATYSMDGALDKLETYMYTNILFSIFRFRLWWCFKISTRCILLWWPQRTHNQISLGNPGPNFSLPIRWWRSRYYLELCVVRRLLQARVFWQEHTCIGNRCCL